MVYLVLAAGRLQQEDQPDNLALEDEGPFEEEPSKATAALNALRGEAVQCLAAISSAGVKYLLEVGS